jgi:hypothetical protein
MSDCKIEFHADPALLGKIPPPIPATRAVPDWYRKMPQDNQQYSTVKRCVPFLDALTAGYMIPIMDNVRITLSAAGELKVQQVTEEGTAPLVQVHALEQFPGAPFPSIPALKFNSPWIIKTPPGYSTLFVSPFNRIELPILPLAGIVDTDTFYIPVSFPALYLLPPGSELEIPRGTPIVQAIPFKRDAWSSLLATVDEATFAPMHKAANEEDRVGYYRDGHWQRKSFT